MVAIIQWDETYCTESFMVKEGWLVTQCKLTSILFGLTGITDLLSTCSACYIILINSHGSHELLHMAIAQAPFSVDRLGKSIAQSLLRDVGQWCVEAL